MSAERDVEGLWSELNDREVFLRNASYDLIDIGKT